MSVGILLALCALAALLEFACMRDETIPDNALSLIGRRLVIAGWTLLSIRFIWLLFEGRTDHVSVVSFLGVGFIALANIIRCSNRLVLTDIWGGAPQIKRN